MKKCQIANCNNGSRAKGFCPMHYARFKGYNKVELEAPNSNSAHHGDGWLIDKDGYKQIFRNGKYVREHRLVMERTLGRKLNSNELVHHKDKNKLNNNPDNLELMSFSEHARHHHTNITNEIKEKVIELYKLGKSMTTIPNILNISYTSVYKIIKKSDIPIRGRHNRNLT